MNLKNLKLLAVFVSIGAAIGLAVPAMAQGAIPETPAVTDLRSALVWIIAGGASVVASIIIDRINAFDSLDTGLRMAAVFGISLVLTTLSRLALQFVPAEVFAVVDVYFKDWLPYILGVSAIFATKAVRTGFTKAKTLTKLGSDPFQS